MLSLSELNSKLISIFQICLIAVLIAIPLGLIYQSIQTAEFMKTCPDHSCGNYLGILYFVLVPAEIYLVLIFFWLRILRSSEINRTWKFIQLIIIFLIGVIPGIIMLYPAFLKD